ncbi:uncharacterized protein BCR38DRAFT_454800 [Pseudomassariella vexata]|uniref:Cytochrome b561 domain-containing protein n=1 Tax=Pseudomassariella vexata TaxID=1141098 RepID=A0A1Y2EGH2_9PEZI|nr:uncharacterized protein BCR38DRAFT_454800 [Pseudomassariella vexata]ORY69895.1 hypothetical protein BCR38DRAFT_454800 [Pseudomassariella vexata]
MAPTDALSAPGTSSYESDTMVVGDGTWDFTKNTFLLPNLMGLNFETMRFNGMGNRFSTLTQYHSLVTAHGVLAVLTFLFIIPIAIFMARFYRGRTGFGVRMHAYLQILAVGFTTVVFILGWFAVGPNRSLTNPHHGIGVAIYTLILVQAIGGRLIRHIRKRSLRIMLHQWMGRIVALLGIAQIPLGLTLYGSPKYTFILFAVWMAILVLLYFVLQYRHEGYRDEFLVHGGRSEATRSRYDVSEHTEKKSSHGWLGPVAAGAGIWALLRGQKNRKERERSRSRSRSVSRSRSRSHVPEVLPPREGSRIGSRSRRDSVSYTDEKYSESPRKRGGIFSKILGIAGVVGAGTMAKKYADRRESRRYEGDSEYTSVANDTPSRHSKPKRYPRPPPTESAFSDDYTDLTRDERHGPLLPGPGDPVAAAAAISAAEPRPIRPVTPQRPTHAKPPLSSRIDSDYSSYDSYVSPSRRTEQPSGSGAGKGLLAGLGIGWLVNKMRGRKDKKAEEERFRVEEKRRESRHDPRYAGGAFMSPTRKPSRRHQSRTGGTTITTDSEFSSAIEPRPPGSGYGGPPMPPLGPAGAGSVPPIVPIPVPGRRSRSRSHSRHSRHSRSYSGSGLSKLEVIEPVDMPYIPPEPHGILHRDESGSESYMSAGGHPHRRHSSRRQRAGEQAAAEATATASALAAEEQSRQRRDRSRSRPPSQPVSVKVKHHDDRITLRRLTDEEAAREQRRRRRSASASSASGAESGGRRRYRRDSSSRRQAEEAAEHMTNEPLSPPTPAFAGGRRQTYAKDSAYYSGGAGPAPSGQAPVTPVHGNPTVSSIGSHGTWSAMSPSPSGPTGPSAAGSVSVSAADRRRRRRLERRDSRPAVGTVDFD